MPESHIVSLWLTRVLDWPQAIAQLLGPVPGWVLVSLIFVPSLIALAIKIWHLVVPILMLNTLIALSAISWPAGEVRTLSIGLASALILAFIGQGLRQRARDHVLGQIETRLDAMDGRIGPFLQVLDQRAKVVDERAIELAKTRLRNEARPQAHRPRGLMSLEGPRVQAVRSALSLSNVAANRDWRSRRRDGVRHRFLTERLALQPLRAQPLVRGPPLRLPRTPILETLEY